MNIRKYEAFVRAVELGSLPKPAEELGFPLMVRTSSGIQPSGEGEQLLLVIRQLLKYQRGPGAAHCQDQGG